MQHYVYIITDPKYKEEHPIYIKDKTILLNYRPIYVGLSQIKGNNGLKDRMSVHLYQRKQQKTAFYDWLTARLNNYTEAEIRTGFIKVIENVSLEEANLWERKFIATIGRKSLNEGPLLNHNDGGGSQGRLDESVKAKISLKNKGRFVGQKNGNYLNALTLVGKNNPYYGKRHTDEVRAKMRRTYIVNDTIQNKTYTTNNLQEFCKENSIDFHNVFNYVNKNRLYKKRWAFTGVKK